MSLCVAQKGAGVQRGREVGTLGICERCAWPFSWLLCSRLSSYPLADSCEAASKYSAYSNDIQEADFAVLWS